MVVTGFGDLGDMVVVPDMFGHTFWGPRDSRNLRKEPGDHVQTITPRMESHVSEDGSLTQVWVEMPGVQRSDMSIESKDHILTIEGVRRRNITTAEVKNGKEHGNSSEVTVPQNAQSESVRFKYVAKFRVHPTMDLKSVSATLEDGVLHIKIPRKPESEPMKISIN